MGDAREGSISFVWVEELVVETFLRYLEFGTNVFDVDSLGAT